MSESKIDIMVSMIDRLTAPMLQATKGIDKMSKQVEAMDKAMRITQRTVGSTGSVFSNHAQTSKRLAQELEGTGKSIMAIGDKMKWMTGTLIAAATAGMKLHSDFANGMAKVSTLIDTDVVSLQKLSDGIRSISDETGASVTDLAEAEYQALSAGVDAAKVTDFLRVSTMAAKAGFTDTATAIDGVTSVLNAYGMEADKAMGIFDQMLMTQNFGKTTLGDMAGALGNVIPVASTLNVSTQELFASIAVLTKNGIQTSAAITGLKGAYSNILKPSKQASELATQLGLDFSAAHLKTVGWANMLDEIREKTGGSADQMATLFGSVEGLNAVLALTGKGHADFAKGLELMNNSAGATEEAFYKLLTPSEQNQIAMNQLKNATMDLAQGLTPLLKGTAQLVGSFAKWLKDLSPEQKSFVENVSKMIVVAGVLTPAVGGALVMFGRTYGTLIDLGVAIQKNGGVMGALAKRFEGTTGLVKALRGEFSFFGQMAGSMKATAFTKVSEAIQGIGNRAISMVSRAGGAFMNLSRLILNPMTAFSLLRQGAASALGGITGILGRAGGAFMNLGRLILNPMTAFSLLRQGAASTLGGITGILGRAGGAFMNLGRLILNPMMAFNLLRQGALTAFRGIMLAMRVSLLSPMGIGITLIVGLGYLLYKNWDTIKNALIGAFEAVKTSVGGFAARVSEKFSGIWTKAQGTFGRLLDFIKLVWNGIQNAFNGGGGTIGQVLSVIVNLVSTGFVTAFNVALNAVETAINIITTVIGGVLDVIGGVITVLTGVITGDWAMVWQGAVEIFSGIFGAITGICDNVLQGIKGAINAVIGGINSISVSIPEWVPVVGGQNYTPSIPYLAHGTDNFPGGLAVIHDAGPELVDLPQGTRVIPHDKSMREEYRRGQRDGIRSGLMGQPAIPTGGSQSITINIPKIAESIIIREDADIAKIAQAIAEQLERRAGNQMVGAV